MRRLLLADVHSNLEAFQAVLEAAQAGGPVNEIWCLGDIVGYGPDPHQCLTLLRQYPHRCVAGNHDLAAIGKVDTSEFNASAAAAARWTGLHLETEDQAYLENLPLKIEVGDFTLAHGSPRHPIWEYLLYPEQAQQCLAHFQTLYCLVGHSHVPLLIECPEGHCRLAFLPPFLTLRESRLILNPGGVGQPRDQEPRASFAIYNDNAQTIEHHRVAYNIALTQKKIRRAGLPSSLADRLSLGW